MSYTTTRNILLCCTLLFAACAPTEDDLVSGPRGSVGKADHVSGTCVGACGGKSTGTCWCDELCSDYGDCCDDAGEVCSVDECNADGTGCHDGDTCVAGEPNLCSAPASCGAQDAAGVGLCEMFMGYVWNGLACAGVSGCSCEGADCGSLTLSKSECESAHAHCLPGEGCPAPGDPAVDYHSYDTSVCAAIRFDCPDGWAPFSDECGCGCKVAEKMCGGILAASCDEGEFCDYGAHCGSGDQSGVCRPMPEVCTAEYVGVCGCDGETYATVCTAHQHGVSVVDLGPCAPAPDSCDGHCGGQSEDGSCWCDSWCSYYGDCCDDRASVCS